MSDQSPFPGLQPGSVPPSTPPVGPHTVPPSAPPMMPPTVSEGAWSSDPYGGSPTYQSRAIGGPVPEPAPNPTSAATKGGAGLLLGGLVLIVVGLVAGAVLLVLSGRQSASAVEDLARAPVGCETQLDVSETGTFYFYVETAGTIGDVDGTCSNDDRDYDLADIPRVTLTLTDRSGEELDLERTSGLDYDTGDHVGSVVRSVEIDDPGRYTLLVDSRDDDAVVAVGRDVTEVGAGLGLAGIAVLAAGVLGGLVVLLLGVRARRRPRSSPSAGWPATPATTATWQPTAPPPPPTPPASGPSASGPSASGPWQPPTPLS